MNILICFEIKLNTGETKTCVHQNFNKAQFPKSAFSRAAQYCEQFGLTLPKSAYTWRKAKILKIVAGEKAMREEIKKHNFATKLYPDDTIIDIHLYIQRTDW